MKDHRKTKASSGESKWKLPLGLGLAALLVVAAGVLIPTLASAQAEAAGHEPAAHQMSTQHPDQVLDWNQIFIDTLIATNTPNSSSQRLGAIVHAAIFDAYNGIERRYAPIFVDDEAPAGASRRAAVIAAAYTALVALFPAREPELSASYAASLAALSATAGTAADRASAASRGETQVAQAVLAWRANDGFGGSYPPFIGGTAVGQWRPTPPSFGPMSAQGLAFTATFVLDSNTQFRPAPPRPLTSSTYTDDFNAVKALGRRNGSTRTPDQTALARFWEFNASVHWNQAANQIARANHLSMSDSNRLLAILNIAMADTAITTWSAKRYYGAIPTEVTWRPVTAIPLADTDGNPDTVPDPDWLPLINTPSHPEYAAGHPSLNGAAATVLLANFGDAQTFTLTATGLPNRTYTSIAQAARTETTPASGAGCTTRAPSRSATPRASDRQLRQCELDAAGPRSARGCTPSRAARPEGGRVHGGELLPAGRLRGAYTARAHRGFGMPPYRCLFLRGLR